eukprot:CAMPEP_0182882208 /NCGR_PEP_ID=MMETSP0034_2-20130328/17639_1 /TAXON_ID=156128 /ORGANISM="Nephroselmis pyriformis, Strain CCMP717" /LENGTH=537 /DNA_ID=CAMNT_0025015287 /DNA_START=51 /DNA_END=1664 /DNA_ORIENTATION=-
MATSIRASALATRASRPAKAGGRHAAALALSSRTALSRPAGLRSSLSLGAGARAGRGAMKVSARVADPATTTANPSEPDPSSTFSIPPNPWEEEPWASMKWTVYRGEAYDLQSYHDIHPGGSWLLNLAEHRDATALFESYHMRPEVAGAHIKRLPKIEGFPIKSVPKGPYPNDSAIYNKIRERVRKEIFQGKEAQGAHREGAELACATIIGYALVTYAAYAAFPSILTAGLFGLAGAWIGLTIQHCGNHGAMSNNPAVNLALGLSDDVTGGSSLAWRYHHQVSHHIHCNDEARDEDVHSGWPVIRFDASLPQRWWHKYQHIYLWVIYPFLTLSFHAGDISMLLTNKTSGSVIHGARTWEKATVVAGKVLHFFLLLGLPTILHGNFANQVVSWLAGYVAVQSIVLATTFAVSHNVQIAKEWNVLPEEHEWRQDWGVQQILTSANWGDRIGNFFTGGLNLQIEHHLFPAVSFHHYPAIAKIVRQEAEAAGVPYSHYNTLPEILGEYMKFMKQVGSAPTGDKQFSLLREGAAEWDSEVLA